MKNVYGKYSKWEISNENVPILKYVEQKGLLPVPDLRGRPKVLLSDVEVLVDSFEAETWGGKDPLSDRAYDRFANIIIHFITGFDGDIDAIIQAIKSECPAPTGKKHHPYSYDALKLAIWLADHGQTVVCDSIQYISILTLMKICDKIKNDKKFISSKNRVTTDTSDFVNEVLENDCNIDIDHHGLFLGTLAEGLKDNKYAHVDITKIDIQSIITRLEKAGFVVDRDIISTKGMIRND